MNKLTQLRATRGLTVRELATKSGVSPTTINRLERGYLKSHPVTIGRLAAALGVDLVDLTEFINNNETTVTVHDKEEIENGVLIAEVGSITEPN